MYAIEKEFAGECGFFGGLSLKEREGGRGVTLGLAWDVCDEALSCFKVPYLALSSQGCLGWLVSVSKTSRRIASYTVSNSL